MSISLPDGIRPVETDEEREAVFCFRYDVYVEEMGRYHGVADHERRRFAEPEDAHSRIFYAARDGRVVGTGRLTWGGDGPFSKRQVEQYSLQPFLSEVPLDVMGIGERAMVAKHLRGTDLFHEMGRCFREFVQEHRIQLIFGACEPHLLPGYLRMGQRTYAKRNINSPEAGYLIPLIIVPEDIDYLRRINSPALEHAIDYGDDKRIPECVARLVNSTGAVRSGELTAPDAYFGEVHGAIGELEEGTLSAFDGLSEDEAIRCLGKSNIIECSAGDRVLKKGGVARNLFVVLDGTLEVRNGDDVVNVLGPGEVFGEIAFLLGRPRSMDVYAATDGVRVLSLSESTMRQAIERTPEIAAHLLLNMSKMLCLRLLRWG